MTTTSPQPSSQRARQRAETHERIFEAAVEEFRTAGYAQAQIPRIAKAAGVVRGTFYFHFPSKEHVLRELAERVQDDIASSLASLRDRELPFAEVLQHLVESIVRVDESLSGSDLIRDVVALQVRDGMSEEPREAPVAIRNELERQAEAAIARGELRPGLAPEAVSGLILTSIFGVMVSPRGEGPGRRPALHGLVDLMLLGATRRAD